MVGEDKKKTTQKFSILNKIIIIEKIEKNKGVCKNDCSFSTPPVLTQKQFMKFKKKIQQVKSNETI